MKIDLLSYIRQVILPNWREPKNVGLAFVLYRPMQYLLDAVEKYSREAHYRAGLTGQKIILESYLQQVVDPLVQIKNQDGLRWDFAVIVPQNLSDEKRLQVRELVDAYKLAGKRYEIRTAFALAGGGSNNTGLGWHPGFPVYANGLIAWAINRQGGFLTRIKEKNASTYLIDENKGYLAGQVFTIAAPVGDYDIQVDKLNYALYVSIAQYSFSIASVNKIPNDVNNAWRINLAENVRGEKDFTIRWFKGAGTTPISTFAVPGIDTNVVNYLYFNPKLEDPWKIKSNGPGTYRVSVTTIVGGQTYTDDAVVTFAAADLGDSFVTLPVGGISSNVIDKALLALDWGGSWGNDEVLFSDGSYHNGYWFTTRQSPIPVGLSVSNFAKMKGIIDYWAAKQGTSVTMPVYWDRCNPAPDVYIFAQIRWAMEYAITKGLKVNFFLKANRRWTADPAFNTCTDWTFNKSDAEIDENGNLHGQPFDHMPALGSSKWENWHVFVRKFAEAISDLANHVGWIAGALNPTQEWGTMYEENSTSHPETIALYKTWHQQRFGTVPASIAKRSDPNSDNKKRTGKFHSWILNQIWSEAVRRIKTVNPDFRCVYHMSSATNETFRRTNLIVPTLLPSYMDGMKHNPARDYDERLAIRSIARPGKMAIIEWTNAEGITSSEMIANLKVAIDNGATGLSLSFFENAWANIGGQADVLLSAVVAALKADAYWTKTYNYNNANPDTIEMSASTAMGTNDGDYEQVYLSAFNASAAAHSGALPSVAYVDDIGGNYVIVDPGNPVDPNTGIENNPNIEYISDYINITIRAKLNDTSGTYSVAIKDGSATVATRTATYGSQFIEFAFATYNGSTDLRGRQLSFVFTKAGVTQTIEYFLPALVLREYTPDYANNADDRVLIPRLTKTFAGAYKIADIGENRGMNPEYFIDGGNGGNLSVLPDISYPVEEQTEIMKNLYPTSGERWSWGENYVVTEINFWIQVRP